jgi:hypothetical protein
MLPTLAPFGRRKINVIKGLLCVAMVGLMYSPSGAQFRSEPRSNLPRIAPTAGWPPLYERFNMEAYEIAAAQAPATDRIDPTEEEAERALERLLVTRGIAVLPPWVTEVEPEFRYQLRGTAEEATRRDTLTAALMLRLGTPFDSQIQVRAPYVLHDRTEFDTTSGIGDVSVTVTKQLLRERGALPNLLISARWTAPTGEESFNPGQLATGSGFHIVEGLLTASVTRDPLVFFGAASYARTLPEKRFGLDVDPGDIVTAKMGGLLAASPDISLSLALTLGFADKVAVAGRRIARTDRVVGVIEIGAAYVMSRKAVFNAGVEIGVTDDASDLGVVFSVPFRF